MCKINPLIVGITTTLASAASSISLLVGAEIVGAFSAAVGSTALTIASIALTVIMVALIVFTAIAAATLVLGAIKKEYKQAHGAGYFFEMMGIVMETLFANITSACRCGS